MAAQSDLRVKYPEFVYESYSTQVVGEKLVIKFKFLIPPDIEFTPQIVIPKIPGISTIPGIETPAFNNLVFHLGLIEMFSYWKATASPLITIRAGRLNKAQIAWWHSLLLKGMGEFFYKNQLDFTAADFLTIKSSTSVESLRTTPDVIIKSDKFLVPVGGGKDSTLSLNLLKKWGKDITPLVLNPTPAALAVIQSSQIKDSIIVSRTIDPRLLELNTQGFYNGHTPFSAYLAFLSLLIARIYQIPQIALSNENSANEANASYLGQQINHQYSKTYEFEKSFREYVSTYLNSNINYFSLLRPLYDIQIAKLFSSRPDLLHIIVSCNRGGGKGKWCGVCPKCVSTFTLLYPFVGEEKITQVFGANLFNNPSLAPRIVELIDPAFDRPFECVGSREESLIALYLATQLQRGDKLPRLLRLVQEKYLVKQKDLEDRANLILSSWDENNFVPQELQELLKNANTYVKFIF